MNKRIRSPSNGNERFSKYLKPGALAKLRDSKISARSQSPTRLISSLASFSPSSTSTSVPMIRIDDVECLEQFVKFSPVFGSQRFGRKKLAAARSSVCFLGFGVNVPAVESVDPIVNVVNSDLFVH